MEITVGVVRKRDNEARVVASFDEAGGVLVVRAIVVDYEVDVQVDVRPMEACGDALQTVFGAVPRRVTRLAQVEAVEGVEADVVAAVARPPGATGRGNPDGAVAGQERIGRARFHRLLGGLRPLQDWRQRDVLGRDGDTRQKPSQGGQEGSTSESEWGGTWRKEP